MGGEDALPLCVPGTWQSATHSAAGYKNRLKDPPSEAPDASELGTQLKEDVTLENLGHALPSPQSLPSVAWPPLHSRPVSPGWALAPAGLHSLQQLGRTLAYPCLSPALCIR